MRGTGHQQSSVFSYISAERRVPRDHPPRAVRALAAAALGELGARFDAIYARIGRPSIPPERLLRALLLQVLYTVRRERLLREQLDYNLRFRWFVGLGVDEAGWDATVFSQHRARPLEGAIAAGFFAAVVEQARAQGWLSDEHFTVGGTLVEAWASRKRFQRKDPPASNPPPDDPGNRASIFMVNGAATIPPGPRLIPKRGRPARGQARKPGSAMPVTC